MSIWNDIRRRGISSEQKKEDQKPNEENLWGSMSPTDILKQQQKMIKQQQISLEDKMAELRRELKKFRWNMECTKRN